MPSPIATGGFQVSAQPGIQYLDPRLLTPNYGGILPAVQQGAAAVGQFQQIQDEARMRPIKAALAQIQLQQEQAKLAQLPIEQQLQRIKLAQISQPIDSVEGISIVNVPRPGAGLQPMLDENDQPMFDANGQPRLENVAGETPKIDTMQQAKIKVFNPVTGETTYEDRIIKPEQTAEQSAVQSSLIDAREAAAQAAAERNQITSERDAARAENDRIKAEAIKLRAENALNDPKWKTVSAGADADGNLIINQVNAAGELRKVPTGEKKSASNFFFGGVNLSTAPVAGAVPHSGIDPDVAALTAQLSGKSAPAVIPAPTGDYASADAVRSAFRSGQITRDEAAKILRDKFGMK